MKPLLQICVSWSILIVENLYDFSVNTAGSARYILKRGKKKAERRKKEG